MSEEEVEKPKWLRDRFEGIVGRYIYLGYQFISRSNENVTLARLEKEERGTLARMVTLIPWTADACKEVNRCSVYLDDMETILSLHQLDRQKTNRLKHENYRMAAMRERMV